MCFLGDVPDLEIHHACAMHQTGAVSGAKWPSCAPNAATTPEPASARTGRAVSDAKWPS